MAMLRGNRSILQRKVFLLSVQQTIYKYNKKSVFVILTAFSENLKTCFMYVGNSVINVS